jgi:hypothetical protein
MEGRTEREAGQAGQGRARAWRWPDGASLLVLLLLAAGLRVWLFCHTEVAARDSIGFIRIAWQLQHQPWAQVLNDSEQHPGYPVLLLLASLPVRAFLHAPDAVVMQVSAQLTSVVAGTLLVIPMFYLGRELFSRTVGFWASVLFQVLPASCRVLSDGLCEATFLLFAATALYLAVRALRGRSPALFGLCGLFSALAYLTRPEGALIAAATGLVLLAVQAVPGWRRPWSNFLAAVTSLALVSVVAGCPIYLATGRFSIKPSTSKIVPEMAGSEGLTRDPVHDDDEVTGRGGAPGVLRPGEPAFASLLAVWWRDPKGPHHRGRVVWGLWALGYEINKGFHYAGWLSALLGLWWFRDRLRVVPGAWVLLLLSVTIALLLWRLATVWGYLSDRHTLLLLLGACYWAAAALAALGERLAALLRSWSEWAVLRLAPRPAGRLVMAVLLAALVGSALPKALEPLHTSRGGFRAAGLWLGAHARPADEILDPYCWTKYYAGRIFQEGPPPAGPGHPRYVVLDKSNAHPHLPEQQRAERLAAKGTPVYRWPDRHGEGKADIVIYEIPSE